MWDDLTFIFLTIDSYSDYNNLVVGNCLAANILRAAMQNIPFLESNNYRKNGDWCE